MKIFGFDLRQILSRTAFAVMYGILTVLVFYELPNLLLKNLPAGSNLGNLPFENEAFFLSYAILITVLSGLQIVFQGHYIGDAAAVSSGVAQIIYIYTIANGGLLTDYIGSIGLTLSINFQTILYLMMIPSGLSIVASIVSCCSRVSVKRSDLLIDEVTI
jgi:hypothetical protein